LLNTLQNSCKFLPVFAYLIDEIKFASDSEQVEVVKRWIHQHPDQKIAFINSLKGMHLATDNKVNLLLFLIDKNEEAAIEFIKQMTDHPLLVTATQDVKSALYLALMQQGDQATEYLLSRFDSLNLKSLTEPQRIAFRTEVERHLPHVSQQWRTHGYKLDLSASTDGATFKKYAAEHPDTAIDIIRNFRNFGLHNLTWEQKAELFQCIIASDRKSADYLLDSAGFLELQQAPLDLRLQIARFYMRRYSESKLLANLPKFHLEDASLAVRQQLFEEISRRDGGKDSLMYYFNRLPLQGFSNRQIHHFLISLLYGQSNQFYNFMHNFKEFEPFSQAVLVDICAPPTDIFHQDYIDGKIKGSACQPFVNLLLKDELDLATLRRFISERPPLHYLLKALDERLPKLSPQQQVELAKIIAFAAFKGQIYDEDQHAAVQKSGLLDAILDYRQPSQRWKLVRGLYDLAEENIKCFEERPQGMPPRASADLAWIPLRKIGLGKEEASVLYRIILAKGGFDDAKKLSDLLDHLFEVAAQGPYSSEQKQLLMQGWKEILGDKRKPFATITTELQMLTNVLMIFEREEFLKCLQTKTDPLKYFLANFTTIFNVGPIDNLLEKYQETFGSFRDKKALFTYYRALQILPEEQKIKALASLSLYVNAVLRGNYPAVCYDPKTNPHLEKVFAADPTLAAKWCAHDKPKEIFLSPDTQSARKNLDLRRYFHDKLIVDKHLDLESYPQLREVLMGVNVDVEGVKKPLEKTLIALIQGKIPPMHLFEEVSKILPLASGELAIDLKALQNMVRQIRKGVYTVKESSDPCDRLLIGTEINGSCQRVNGGAHLNKCLVGYLLNGEISAIVVKDETDQLVARSIIRLLLDAKTGKPVVLQERMYSNIHHPLIEESINAQAAAVAKRLGIPLVSKEVGQGPLYPNHLIFHGGLAPFAYCDALGRAIQPGDEIADCFILSMH